LGCGMRAFTSYDTLPYGDTCNESYICIMLQLSNRVKP
jgi:hypothetical protein